MCLVRGVAINLTANRSHLVQHLAFDDVMADGPGRHLPLSGKQDPDDDSRRTGQRRSERLDAA